MAEKRKPVLTILLKNKGKTKSNKVELFHESQFSDDYMLNRSRRWRLRVNGRWNDKQKKGNKKWFTKWEFRDLLFRSLDI